MDKLKSQQPDLMLNLSASPFNYTHPQLRQETLQKNAIDFQLPIFYCNNIGAQTELIFDGGSMVYNRDAQCCALLPHFEESIQTIDIASLEPIELPNYKKNKYQLMRDALVLGIKDYFTKMGFKKAILGLC